jgi:ABC-type transport system involved in multi-copper enzyme maturation permease subunit
MLKVIIEKEIRDLIGSTKFSITFGACAILIILAFYVGATRHKMYQAHHEASLSENIRSIEGMTDWNDLDGTKAFLPPQPLAALVSGVSNDIGRTASVRGRGEIKTDDSRYNEDPIFAIFRFIDLEFIFKVILSLFALLLGYDAISGEKERGTLRLSFANALPRQVYIAGKLIGAFLALTISITIAMAIGALLLPLLGVSLSGEEWIRLFAVILTGLLYFGVFLTMSIFVSALTHRSANSFLILLVVWVLCIHIVPRVSVLLAARSVEVPSVDEIAYKKSGLSAQLFDEFDEGMRQYDFSGTATGEGDMLDGFNEYIDSLNDIRDVKQKDFSSRLNEDRYNRQQVQEKLAFALARISPATSLSLATSYLAGSSLRLKNQFMDAANVYQGSFANFMTEKTGMNTGGFIKMRKSTACSGGSENEEEKPEAVDPKELPNFKYTAAGLAESLQASMADIGLLFVLNLLFFAGAFVAFIRYDVR